MTVEKKELNEFVKKNPGLFVVLKDKLVVD